MIGDRFGRFKSKGLKFISSANKQTCRKGIYDKSIAKRKSFAINSFRKVVTQLAEDENFMPS